MHTNLVQFCGCIFYLFFFFSSKTSNHTQPTTTCNLHNSMLFTPSVRIACAWKGDINSLILLVFWMYRNLDNLRHLDLVFCLIGYYEVQWLPVKTMCYCILLLIFLFFQPEPLAIILPKRTQKTEKTWQKTLCFKRLEFFYKITHLYKLCKNMN